MLAATLYLVVALQIISSNIGLVEAFLNKDGDVICKPRKVLIPIDAPLYRYYPRFVEVFRCGGACSTHSPNLQQCLAATWNNISGDIYDLSSSTVKAAAFENHTSCQCECVVRAKDCSENEEFLPDLCNCRCKYENEPPTQCPERFMWSTFQCKCICRGPLLFCPAGQEWSHSACGCICTRSTVERCKYANKYLNASTCECEEQTENDSGPGVTGRRSSSEGIDWKLILIIVLVGLIFLIFLFELYLFRTYEEGCVHWIFAKCGCSSKDNADDNASFANTNNDSTHGTASINNSRTKTLSKSRESMV